MKWDDTDTAKCRWAEFVKKFLDGEVLLDNSYHDYQGDAQVISIVADGRVGMYSWNYGSCSGCDSWEGQDDKIILKEIEESILWWDNPSQFIEWLEGPIVKFHDRSYCEDEDDYQTRIKDSIKKELDKYLTRIFGPVVN
jgi:hypothetical protein